MAAARKWQPVLRTLTTNPLQRRLLALLGSSLANRPCVLFLPLPSLPPPSPWAPARLTLPARQPCHLDGLCLLRESRKISQPHPWQQQRPRNPRPPLPWGVLPLHPPWRFHQNSSPPLNHCYGRPHQGQEQERAQVLQQRSSSILPQQDLAAAAPEQRAQRQGNLGSSCWAEMKRPTPFPGLSSLRTAARRKSWVRAAQTPELKPSA